MRDDLCPTEVWDMPGVVSEYSRPRNLQFPEVMIFIKYRENIWGQRILDVGCGGGRTSYILKKMAKSYIGIDSSEEMIAACRQKFGADAFMCADVRNLHVFKDCSFDFVLFSFNGLDCITHEGRLQGLREICRVLKPGKLFVFSSHNRNFRYAQTTPKLSFCINPITQVKNIYYFILFTRNYRCNKKREVFCPEYAIIRSEQHRFAHLYYYIDKKTQIAQAQQVGFQIIEMHDLEGNVLQEDSEDSHVAWIYYVAKKI